MNITWFGQGLIKIATKTDQAVTFMIDPYDEKNTGLRPPRSGVDIVMISAEGPPKTKFRGTNKEAPFMITGPGEYDVKGVSIRGVATFHDNVQGAKYGTNTVYSLNMEGINLCHLGCLGHALTEKQVAAIGNCDILFIPVGGDRTLDAKQAASLISEIEPRVVIPTHYKVPKLKYKIAAVDSFLKEMGASQVKPESKLKIKRSDLPKEETRVVVLAKS